MHHKSVLLASDDIHKITSCIPETVKKSFSMFWDLAITSWYFVFQVLERYEIIWNVDLKVALDESSGCHQFITIQPQGTMYVMKYRQSTVLTFLVKLMSTRPQHYFLFYFTSVPLALIIQLNIWEESSDVAGYQKQRTESRRIVFNI